MIIKLPAIRDNYIDTEKTPINEIKRQACISFKNFTNGTNIQYYFEDVLEYIDVLTDLVHENSFEVTYRGLLHADLDSLINNGDIPGTIDFTPDVDFCERVYDSAIENKKLGGHNYLNVCSHSHEEYDVKFVLVTIIQQVIETYKELTKDIETGEGMKNT